MENRGLLVIVSGPSGAGKGTVVQELIKDECFALSISATTRKPREGEKEGVHYFFKEEAAFREMIKKGELLEYAAFCGNYYGTPRRYVEKMLDEGKNVILEIEVQGALQIKEKFDDAILIFLTTPNIDELRKRLIGRATETAEKIEMRMNRAKEEILLTDKYDYIIVNDIVEKSAEDIKNITLAEKMAAKRHTDFKDIFLKGVEQ